MAEKLTDKQEIFCREYLTDFNGARAARDAGYSEDNARLIASENLSKPYIQDRIEQMKRERFARLDLDADWTIRELELNVKLARDKGDVNAANTALAQLSRIRGENDDKLRIGRFADMSDEDLQAFIREGT